MYYITKTFEFDYGHRVWSQKLECEFSIDNKCACRHLHGHRGVVNVTLCGEELKDGMVTDFKHLNWFKKWIDEVIDHKFIIDIHDPAFSLLTGHYTFSDNFQIQWAPGKEYAKFLISEKREPAVEEVLLGYTIVDFVPTSENLSKWLYDIVQEKMKKLNINVYSIEFFETPKSRSLYKPGRGIAG